MRTSLPAHSAVPVVVRSLPRRGRRQGMGGTGGQGVQSCPPVFFAVLLLVAAALIGLSRGVDGRRLTSDLPEQSWNAPLAEKSLLLAGDRIGDLAIVVGERGHVLRSEDDGVTWSQIPVPTRSMLCAVEMVDARRGWVGGHDAVILATTDGGLTWQLQHREQEWESPIFDLWFEDANHGIAVGGYGLFLETLDGGSTWKRRTIDEEEPHFYGIASDGVIGGSGEGLILVGEFGTVLSSKDSGSSWKPIECPYAGTLFGALVATTGEWFIFGLRGNIFSSSDQGKTWQALESHTEASLFSSARHEDGTITLVGSEGVLLHRDSASSSFSRIEVPGRPLLSAVLLMQDGREILIGQGGVRGVNIPSAEGNR